MSPFEIKIEMFKAGITQAAIARRVKKPGGESVSRQAVCNVIRGVSKSEPIRREIAAALGRSLEDVFPDSYPD